MASGCWSQGRQSAGVHPCDMETGTGVGQSWGHDRSAHVQNGTDAGIVNHTDTDMTSHGLRRPWSLTQSKHSSTGPLPTCGWYAFGMAAWMSFLSPLGVARAAATMAVISSASAACAHGRGCDLTAAVVLIRSVTGAGKLRQRRVHRGGRAHRNTSLPQG